MSSEPQIPFGFRRVFGQLQKGDGVLDPATGKFKKVKREPTQITATRMRYPIVMLAATVAIRRCDAEQTEIPGTEGPLSFD